VIIDDPHLVGVAVEPLEDHAPLVVDADRMNRPQAALQLLQAVRRRQPQVVQPGGGMDRLQLALGAAGRPEFGSPLTGGAIRI